MKTGGTGGANTNRGGLAFENKTDLAARIERDRSADYELIEHASTKDLSTSKAFDVYRRTDHHLVGIITKQFQFYNILSGYYHVTNQNHKRWKPDEVFFNFDANTIFIVEKKWQQKSGSVDEKIFGFVNKRRLYQNNFNQLPTEPKPTVEFAALFNASWWIYGLDHALPAGTNPPRKNEVAYQDYFDNLRIDGIKIFFDNYDYWWFGL